MTSKVMPPLISVIIPTLNEEQNIAAVIDATRQSGDCEIIVVDGGSTDQTVKLAEHADKIVTAPQGRASQQNAGATVASGEILLFLHADCELVSGFVPRVCECLKSSDVAAGCFTQMIDHPASKYRTIERGNAWRVRSLGWIYGDQGLFVRKETFEQLGGFPDIPLMEDLYFSKSLKQVGRLVVINFPLVVSARRWEKNGTVRQTLRNWSFVVMSHVGVKPSTLARWYGDVREDDVNSN